MAQRIRHIDEARRVDEIPYRISSYRVDVLGHVGGYQRAINRGWLRRLTKAFEWTFFQPPVVSQRANGSLFVVDGQHRLHAAMDLGFGDVEVPVVLYTGLEVAAEAALFSTLNREHRKIGPSELLEAQLYFRDPVAQRIADAVYAAGFRLAWEEADHEHARITATGSLRKLATSYREGVLAEALGIVAGAWGTQATPGAGLLTGTAMFASRYAGLYDGPALLEKLRTVTVHELEAQGRQLAHANRASVTEGIGRAVLATYNATRRRGKLAPWELRGMAQDEEAE